MKDFNFTKLNNDIRFFLKNHNMSQRVFARLVGVSAPTISRILHNDYSLSPENIISVCHVINTPIEKYISTNNRLVYTKGGSTLDNIKVVIDNDNTIENKAELFQFMKIAYNLATK